MGLFRGPRVGLVTAALMLTLGTGCMSLTKEPGAAGGDGAVLLRPQARGLSGVALQDLVVVSKEAAPDVPFTTGLIRKVVDQSKDAVVSIYVRTSTPYRLKVFSFSPLGGIRLTVPGAGLGSGFFIHPSGYILTNNHVIEDADKITVQTSSGKDYDVTVVARDPVYDLALLKTATAQDLKFPALPLGDSKSAAAGDMVIAVGNPLGLGHTVTSGIISQTGRNLTGTRESKTRHANYLQTDTAINPGSSGGPLITLGGAWVGVNTAGATQAQGIGFSVPSEQVLEFLQGVLAGKGTPEAE